MLGKIQYKLFSRSSLDELPIKIDYSGILKDGTIEAIHDQLKHRRAAKQ